MHSLHIIANTAESGKALSSLEGTGAEIESVFKWFSGKNFRGEECHKNKFSELTERSCHFSPCHAFNNRQCKLEVLIPDVRYSQPFAGRG